MAARRTRARADFLADLLSTAVEHGGYGFSETVSYVTPEGDPWAWRAVVRDRYLDPGDDDYGRTWTVDLDTMARGLRVIRNAFYATTEDGRVTALHNRETFERLFFDGDARRELLLADRTNGDGGDYDVVGALAVLECALFGSVVYA